MLALEGRYRARGLRVVSVTREDEGDAVATAARQHGMDYPAFLDVDGAWSRAAGLRGIPAFVVVDKQGRLAYRHAGALEEGSDAFARTSEVVDQALKRRP